MLLSNKYKYSLNRGINIGPSRKDKRARINSYAIISRNTQTQYQTHISEKANFFVLFNEDQYLHRKCTQAVQSNDEKAISSIDVGMQQKSNGFTVFVDNQQEQTNKLLIGLDNSSSIIRKMYKSMQVGNSENSRVKLAVIGIRSQNILTDQLEKNGETQINEFSNSVTKRSILRMKKSESSQLKYQFQEITKKIIRSEKDLIKALQQQKAISNYNQYGSYIDQNYWDWPYGLLYMLEVYDVESDGQEKLMRFHYILRVNQYLQTTSSLMLKLGISLRKLQENTKATLDNNETKLFKFLSNCWAREKSPNINMFFQVGNKATIKEQYLNLVPISEVTSTVKGIDLNFQELQFVYLKNYINYPRLTAFISKLNKDNQYNHSAQIYNTIGQELFDLNKRQKSYAKETMSSIQKRKINQFQQEFQQRSNDEGHNLQSLIQEAANLYREQSDRKQFRLSSHKSKDPIVLKQRRKVLDRLASLQRQSVEYFIAQSGKGYKTQFAKNQKRFRTPNQTVMSSLNEPRRSNRSTAFSIYTKARVRTSEQIPKKGKQDKQFIDQMVRKQIFQLGRQDEYFPFDDAKKRTIY